jgi:hypothetical protein
LSSVYQQTPKQFGLQPVRSAYQPPASNTFLSEQTNHQPSASSTFLSEQISTSHQPPAPYVERILFNNPLRSFCKLLNT